MPLMGRSATRTNLVIDLATFDELYMLAQIAPDGMLEDARALRRALTCSDVTAGSRVRVACCERALAFVRSQAPAVAARFPAVFGAVAVPRSHAVGGLIAHGVGQTVAGLQVDEGGWLRVCFESGAALVVGPAGELEWRAGA